MSEFIDTLSPPFAVKAFDGSTILFRRMLGRHWAKLTEEIRAERLAENDAEITAASKGPDAVPFADRQVAREKVRQFIRQSSDIDSLVQYCRSDINGVTRLLKFAAVDCGMAADEWAKYEDTIPTLAKLRIADEIVFVPIVNPPQPPPGNSVAGEGQSGPTTPASTGETVSTTVESAGAIPPK